MLFLTILLMSGLHVFNAHPALYSVRYSILVTRPSDNGATDQGGASRGITTVAGHQFDTTGWLGLSKMLPDEAPPARSRPG